MTQRTIGSTGIVTNYDVNGARNLIAYLRSVMVPGSIINSSDINNLINLWNGFNVHQHNISDLHGIRDFGDGTGDPGYGGGLYGTVTSNPAYISGGIGGIASGQTITSGKTNELVNAFSGRLWHQHGWSDSTS